MVSQLWGRAERKTGEFKFFLELPLEIRNMIYEPFIQAAIIESRPPLYGISTWQTPSFNYAHKLDLHIKRNKVIFRNMRFLEVYPLFMTNWQIHNEMSELVFSRIHHIRISGDFLLGLASTKPLFDMIQRRPWMQNHVKSVCVELRLCGTHNVCNAPGIDDCVIRKHPLLLDKMRDIWERAEMPFAEQLTGAKEMRNCTGLFVFFGNMGLERLRRAAIVLRRMVVPRRPELSEHNTLPDLANVLKSFRLLEKVDFETEHRQLISMFPSPVETARTFQPFLDRAVEINVVLRKWQLHQWAHRFSNKARDKLQFWHENGGQVGLAYEGQTGGGMWSYGLVRYRLSDALEQKNL